MDDLNACEPLIDKVLNVDLPEHIPKLKKCLENPIFKKWFEDKFCKWIEKIELPDMVFLWENIDTFLENQEDKLKFKVSVCPVENPEQAKKVIEIEIKRRVFFSKSWKQRHNIPN